MASYAAGIGNQPTCSWVEVTLVVRRTSWRARLWPGRPGHQDERRCHSSVARCWRRITDGDDEADDGVGRRTKTGGAKTWAVWRSPVPACERPPQHRQPWLFLWVGRSSLLRCATHQLSRPRRSSAGHLKSTPAHLFRSKRQALRPAHPHVTRPCRRCRHERLRRCGPSLIAAGRRRWQARRPAR
jgi:hypothetical protein